VFQRERIDVGTTIVGPAILDQFDATTVLEPGQVARVDEYKNLIVSSAVIPAEREAREPGPIITAERSMGPG
jgi:hypothetical protein